MEIPAPEKIVVAGPGQSVAAQVATNVVQTINETTGPEVPNLKPVDVVDREFVESIGIRTSGWIHVGKTFWKEHSTQFWVVAIGLQTFLQSVQDDIPPTWEAVGHWTSVALGALGLIMKVRIQGGLIIENIRNEVRRHTE